MSTKLGIYLARSGKVHGPFTEPELEKMMASGQIQQFTWIWDQKTSAWKALDPAPAPLSLEGSAPAKRAARGTAATATDPHAIQVVCHDFQTLIAGSLAQITETGCELLSTDLGGNPKFTPQSRLILNLLNEKTGQAMNVQAKLLGVARVEGAWSYKLRWEHCPELLQAA